MHLRYVLDGSGWSQLTLTKGRHSTTIVGSYLNDCAADLAKATTRLLGGSSAEEVIFEGEPNLTLLRLEQLQDRQVRVQVFLGLGANGDDLQSARLAPPAFNQQVPLLSFARQVGTAFQALLDEHGAQGYQKKWGFPFPEDQLRAITAHTAML